MRFMTKMQSMSTNKTQIEPISADDFLAEIAEPGRREEAETLAKLFREEAGELNVWTGGMVGAGIYTYAYPGGRTNQWFPTGFAIRKAKITLYFLAGFDVQEDLLKQVGKHKVGKSCFYVNKLADIDLEVVRKMIHRNQENMGRVSKNSPV